MSSIPLWKEAINESNMYSGERNGGAKRRNISSTEKPFQRNICAAKK